MQQDFPFLYNPKFVVTMYSISCILPDYIIAVFLILIIPSEAFKEQVTKIPFQVLAK